MTSYRPLVEVSGTPNTVRKLANDTGLLADQIVDRDGNLLLDRRTALAAARGAHRSFVKNPGANTWTPVGFAASPSTTGTLTNDDTNSGSFVKLATAATDLAEAHVAGSFSETRIGRFPFASVRIKTGSNLTHLRYWIGLSAALITDTDGDVADHACIRFDPADASDTHFVASTSDGGASGVTDTGVTPATSTEYVIEIACARDGHVYFMINGAVVADRSTNLPVAGNSIGFFASVTAREAVSKTLSVGHINLLAA